MAIEETQVIMSVQISSMQSSSLQEEENGLYSATYR